ncbi:hypothetical protein BD779DRAFT_1668108 [Infundibulicybe gibba]|nr:hypothetical protein BD779DRAFT_1668108 [Infundibulicybe gibba]
MLGTVPPVRVLSSITVLGAFVHSSVQLIYTYRLYKLSGYWVFPAIFLALSAYYLGSGIAYTTIELKLLVDSPGQLSTTSGKKNLST